MGTDLTIIGLAVGAIAAVIAYLQLRRMPRRSSLEENEQVAVSTGTEPPRHNLPLPRKLLVGRQEELERVTNGFLSRIPVVCLEGMGGIGKTAIAQEVAWKALNGDLEHEFRAVTWTEDREGSLTLDQLMDIIAEAIGYPYLKGLKTSEKQAQVLNRLREIPTLVIVDNYETIQDSRILTFLRMLPSPQTKAIVTTRERLIDDAWMVEVRGLPQKDANSLLTLEATRLSVPAVLNASPSLISEFHVATEGNPLAILLSVGQAYQGISSLGDTVANLQGTKPGELLITIFQRIWNHAILNDDQARRALIVMSLHSSSVSRAALEAGCEAFGSSMTNTIRRLVELSLLETYQDTAAASFRYRIHALTRSFTWSQEKSDPTRIELLERRLIDFYLDFARRHENTYSSVEHVRALELEHSNLLTFAKMSNRQAVCSKNDESRLPVIGYANTLAPYLWGRGYWRDRLELCGHAIKAAETLGDHLQVSRQQALIGRIYLWLGEISVAKDCLHQSQLAVHDDPSELAQATPRRLRAQIASREGDYELAQRLLAEVLKSAPHTVDDEGRAATLVELGVLAEIRGEWHEATSYYKEALRLDEQLGTLEGQAVSLSHLGNVELAMSQHLSAMRSFTRGLDLATQVDRLSAKGRCQYGLAQVYQAMGDRESSTKYATAAAASFARLGIKEVSVPLNFFFDERPQER